MCGIQAASRHTATFPTEDLGANPIISFQSDPAAIFLVFSGPIHIQSLCLNPYCAWLEAVSATDWPATVQSVFMCVYVYMCGGSNHSRVKSRGLQPVPVL